MTDQFKFLLEAEWRKRDPNYVDYTLPLSPSAAEGLGGDKAPTHPAMPLGPPSPPRPPQPPLAKPPEAFWRYQVTPPLPCVWPPSNSNMLRYYVFAFGQSMRIADGVRTAAPWACIEAGPDGVPKLELLSESLREIGIQSMRPLCPEESADFALRGTAEGYVVALRAAPPGYQAGVIRRFYRIWSSGNGVIVKEIRPRHEAFLAWLRG